MSNKFISYWFYSSLDTHEEPTLLGFSSKTKSSQRNINMNEFSESLRKTYENFDADGYDVINVVPVAMGQAESCSQQNGSYLGDVGFSITRGAVVIGKRRES